LPTPPTAPNGTLIRERNFLYGPPGVGKTHQFFNIAKWHQELGSPARFYGISSDTAYEALICNTEFEGLTNIEWTDVTDFQDYIDAAKHYHEIVKQGDWVSVDLLDGAWAAAADEYAQGVAKEKGLNIDDLGDLWKEEGGSDYPIKGWDWGIINARYRRFTNRWLLTSRAHLMLVSGEVKLTEPTDKMRAQEDAIARRTREMFKHVGTKPMGQKEDPFRWHSVLRVDCRDEGGEIRKQQVVTAKERYGNRRMWGRRMQNGIVRPEPMEDYFMDYLVKTAGWEI